MPSIRKHVLFILVCVLTLPLMAVPKVAHADLTITPTRLVFKDRDRFKEVTLVNTSDKVKTYEMGWNFFRMLEQKPYYEPVEGSLTEFDMTKHIVFTPRRVTLQPGAKQKIRLALRRPPEVPPGEYRAHLKFAGVSTPTPDKEGGKPSAVVSINVGYTIPVVFQAGQEDVAVQIESLQLQRNQVNGRLEAVVSIARSGNYGAIGHLYLSNNGEVVGEIGNAHIFTEVPRRVFVVPLLRDNLTGSLDIELRRYDDKTVNYAQRSFPVQ